MSVRIQAVNIDEADHLAAAFAVRAEMALESHPDGPAATVSSVRRQLIGSEVMGRFTLLAFRGAEPVGLLRMMFWDIEGSRDLAVCNLEVRPAHRRRGIGTDLLRAGLAHGAERQKSIVIGTGILSDATQGFWGDHLGLSCGLVERESRLQLVDVDGDLMQRWIEQRCDRAADYRVEHVRGPFPPELRSAVATLKTAMNDAPDDDLELDDETWTATDVEADDQFRLARGEQRWSTIAFTIDGQPAGMTEVILIDEDETFGVQGNTAVLADHRDRGIGRWLKADMWQRLRAHRPTLESLLVENAASNAAMLAINDAMGFRETVRYADWQGEISQLAARLAEHA